MRNVLDHSSDMTQTVTQCITIVCCRLQHCFWEFFCNTNLIYFILLCYFTDLFWVLSVYFKIKWAPWSNKFEKHSCGQMLYQHFILWHIFFSLSLCIHSFISVQSELVVLSFLNLKCVRKILEYKIFLYHHFATVSTLGDLEQ